MPGRPISVDYIRHIFDISPEEMTDADLRRALAFLTSDSDAEDMPADVAESLRRLADAIDRATFD
jgi:hypothetical protein